MISFDMKFAILMEKGENHKIPEMGLLVKLLGCHDTNSGTLFLQKSQNIHLFSRQQWYTLIAAHLSQQMAQTIQDQLLVH